MSSHLWGQSFASAVPAGCKVDRKWPCPNQDPRAHATYTPSLSDRRPQTLCLRVSSLQRSMNSSFLFLLPKSYFWSLKPLSVISPLNRLGKLGAGPCSESRESMEENWEQKQLGPCAKAGDLLCVLKVLSWMPVAVPCFPTLSSHSTRQGQLSCQSSPGMGK